MSKNSSPEQLLAAINGDLAQAAKSCASEVMTSASNIGNSPAMAIEAERPPAVNPAKSGEIAKEPAAASRDAGARVSNLPAAPKAPQPISDTLALQESFNIWPASTIPPGQRRSGEIHGYHIDCIGGYNRVTNSNTVRGNGALGTARPGAPRQCTGFEVNSGGSSSASAEPDTSINTRNANQHAPSDLPPGDQPAASNTPKSDQIAKATPQQQPPATPSGSPSTPGTGNALPVPPTVPAPTAGLRPGNTSVGVVCNSATGQGCGQPPAAPQFPGGANAKAPTPQPKVGVVETRQNPDAYVDPIEEAARNSTYNPPILGDAPSTATSPSVSTGTGTGTATTTNPAPAPATPTDPPTGTGTPKSPAPQQPPLDVEHCTQGALFYIAVVINPKTQKQGQYRVTNACKTLEVKVWLKTADVRNKESTDPYTVQANSSEEVDSYNDKVPETIKACFVGSPGC